MRLAFAVIALAAAGCVENTENVVAVDVQVEHCGDDEARAIASVERGLSDWGTWSEDETFGTIWTPNDADFVPYASDGHFADIGGELVWVSDLAWGTTLHHGRWVRCKDRWSWVPGAKYAGAWVTTRRDGDRTTWSPTPPTRIWRRGVSFPIAAPDAPIVGARADDELALVPPDPRPTRVDANPPPPTADEERERTYQEIGRHMAEMGDDARRSFGDFGGEGGRGATSSAFGHASSGGSGGHGGHVSSGHVSSHGGSHGHATGGHH